ncbi:MAG: cbb3-type cytochrome c oxidase N-terminal domain-containing protein [Chitinophagales bacterium]
MNKIKLKNVFTIFLLSAGLVTQAQDAAATAAPAATPGNASESTLLWMLLAACVVLLIAILILGNVMVKLAKMAYAKHAARMVALLVAFIGTGSLFAQDAPAAAAAAAPASHAFDYNLWLGFFVMVIELGVVIWMLLRIRTLLVTIAGEEKDAIGMNVQMPRFFDRFNDSVAVEKESDILLDHDYDGIQELDNSLPPWWKYSFYISIVWAFFYLMYYFVGGGPSSIDEFNTEVQQAKIEVDAYNKKNALNVDESNVTLADDAGILEGKDIFKANCAACHGNLGEGNVGPNLTDDYWLHGGTLSEVFKTVKYGWPAKGMKSWQADLSPVQIKNVVSYIHSIHGSNPANAKAPQGDLMAAPAAGAPADSSATAVADTTAK